MIVKSAPIIPRYKNCCAIPIWSLHCSIDETSNISLTIADFCGWMLTYLICWDNPCYGRQRAIFGSHDVLVDGLDVIEFAVFLHSIKCWQRIPNAGYILALIFRLT